MDEGYYWVKRWPESNWILVHVRRAGDGMNWATPGVRYLGGAEELLASYMLVGPIRPPDIVAVNVDRWADDDESETYTKSIQEKP